MLNHFLQKNYRYRSAIACLGLALFVVSCAASEVTEEPVAETPTTTNPPEQPVAPEAETTPPSTSTSTSTSSTSTSTPAASQATPIAPQTTPVSERNRVPTSREVATATSPAPSAPKVEAKQPSGTDIETTLKNFAPDTPYSTVRPHVIQDGWIPVDSSETLSPVGLERELYDAGFTEAAGCAGSGLGQCRFDFKHPDKQQGLSLITYGSDELKFNDWNIYPLTAATPTEGDLVTESRSAIPVQFQGTWDWENGRYECGSPLSEGNLVIGLNRLKFYESSGSVSEVLVTGDLEMTTTAEYSGEGSTWTETDTFQLSPDYSTLTDVGTGAVRIRCSS